MPPPFQYSQMRDCPYRDRLVSPQIYAKMWEQASVPQSWIPLKQQGEILPVRRNLQCEPQQGLCNNNKHILSIPNAGLNLLVHWVHSVTYWALELGAQYLTEWHRDLLGTLTEGPQKEVFLILLPPLAFCPSFYFTLIYRNQIPPHQCKPSNLEGSLSNLSFLYRMPSYDGRPAPYRKWEKIENRREMNPTQNPRSLSKQASRDVCYQWFIPSAQSHFYTAVHPSLSLGLKLDISLGPLCLHRQRLSRHMKLGVNRWVVFPFINLSLLCRRQLEPWEW